MINKKNNCKKYLDKLKNLWYNASTIKKQEEQNMKIYKEVTSYYDFDFWSGAKQTADEMTAEQIEEIFAMLEECYPDGMTDTELNDFFWFEDETIAEWLGFDSFEKLCAYNRGEEDEEQDEEEAE